MAAVCAIVDAQSARFDLFGVNLGPWMESRAEQRFLFAGGAVRSADFRARLLDAPFAHVHDGEHLAARDLDRDGQRRVFAQWRVERSRVLAGISGGGGPTFEETTEPDVDYIRNWSLKLPLVAMTGKGAR